MASPSRNALYWLAALPLMALPMGIQAADTKAKPNRSLSTVESSAETLKDAPARKVKPSRAKSKKGLVPAKKKTGNPVLKKIDPTQGLKLMLPDLQVEISNPGSNSQPAIAKVHNKGNAPVSATFLTLATAEVSCEVGKLKSDVAVANKTTSLQPIAVGGFRTVSILPASGSWVSSGCYYNIKLKADSGGTIKESNDQNNFGFAHFCPQGGSCY